MSEDQDLKEIPIGEPKKSKASESLFEARKRVAAETKYKDTGAPKPEKIWRSESGRPLTADYKLIDETDALLLGEAEEIQSELVRNPKREGRDKLEFQVETLSKGVGREKATAAGLEARLYGLGFLQQRSLERFPEDIRDLVRRTETPKDSAELNQASRELEMHIANLPDRERGEVRNLLWKRGTVNRLIDHFDYLQSGEMSLQERVVGFVGDSAREGTLRRMVANEVVRGWRKYGPTTELRPSTMHSRARLAMERQGADPIGLMAMKVAESREELEGEVETRLGEKKAEVSGKAAGEAKAVEAGAGAEPEEEGKEGVVLGKVPTEKLEVSKSRIQELIDQGKSLDEAIGTAKKEAGAKAETKAEPEEKQKPKSKREVLEARIAELDREMKDKGAAEDDWPGYGRLREERERVASQLKALDAEAKAGTGTAQAPAKEAKAVPEAEKLILTPEEQQLKEELVKFFGKDLGEIHEKLKKVAAGEMPMKNLVAEIAGKDKGVRKVLYHRFREELRRRGIPEDQLKQATDEQLQEAFNKSLDAAIDKKITGERRTGLKAIAWFVYFWGLFWEELIEPVKQEIKREVAEVTQATGQ